jgi:hypothetical protein
MLFVLDDLGAGDSDPVDGGSTAVANEATHFRPPRLAFRRLRFAFWSLNANAVRFWKLY